MDMKKSKKLLVWSAVFYWVLVICIYLIAHPQFRYTSVVSDALSASTMVGEIVDGMQIEQSVRVPTQRMEQISLLASTYGRQNSGSMLLTVSDENHAVIAQQSVELSAFHDGKYTTIILDNPIEGRKGEKLNLHLKTQGALPGSGIALYAGNTVTAGRFDIVQNISEEDRYQLDGYPGAGMLCVKFGGVDELDFYKTYWLIVSAAFVLMTLLCWRWWKQAKQKKNNPLVAVCTMYTRYGFLIKQLVSRDFKTKYKRSVLGMAWSFLNPLMTMFVQYIVFSRLFRSDIPNYPIYLFTGIVFFNFFSEAVGVGMSSITGNASLIKKVYMPKYIYPISKILSSTVNFGLAIIPLFLIMVFTGTRFTPALILLVFDIACMLGFVIGMVLLLTTAMTFFQDTQFLWGVISMMWMYLTPVFYPENIIPANLLTLYHMNPLYQYITFARICIMEGVSPAPTAYLWCIVSSVVVLAVGILVFKKNQDEFVLHL